MSEPANGHPSVKEAARRLVDDLPPQATWEDLMERLYVRQAIDSGLADARAGRVASVEEVRARFGLAS